MNAMSISNLHEIIIFRLLGGFPLEMLLRTFEGRVQITKKENHHPSVSSYILEMIMKSVKKSMRKPYSS